MKYLLPFSVVAAGLLAFATQSQAQNILWSTAQNMVGDADVRNNGTAFDAITFNGASLTVNGVTFNPLGGNGTHTDGTITITNGDNTGAFGFAFSMTSPSSANYSSLVNTGTFGENNNIGSFNLVTIANLTPGNIYQVQSWSYYTQDGTAVTNYSGANTATLTNATGQFAVGTFTADNTATETYNYYTGGTGHNFVNVVSVRDISVPEPSTYALLGGSFAALMLACRRKLSV